MDSLKALAAERPRVVVAGTMLELGERSPELHARVARGILASNVDLLVATGSFAGAAGELEAEYAGRVIVDSDVEPAYERLAERLVGGEVVLLKASRGVRLERLIPRFERDFDGGDRELEA